MLIEKALIQYLKADAGVEVIVDGRVHPFILPQSTQLPALTLQRVSGERIVSHSGASELGIPRIQVDCYAMTYEEAKELAEAVRFALHAKKFTITFGLETLDVHAAFEENEIDMYEGDTKLWRVLTEFRVWHEEETV